MNIPNLLTLLRLILVPVVVIFLMDGAYVKALFLLAFLGITDALDGFLARVLHQQTALGAYMDPIADKVLITTCFVTLAIGKIVPGWLAVIVISRDVMILLGIAVLFMMSISFAVRPAMISKVTTVLQILTVFFALIAKITVSSIDDAWIHLLYVATAAVTVLSGLHYILRGVRYINDAPRTPPGQEAANADRKPPGGR